MHNAIFCVNYAMFSQSNSAKIAKTFDNDPTSFYHKNRGDTMAVTIKDIAKAANVSPSTVSRVINDHYSISEKTKEKIRAIMDEMGYKSASVVEDIKTIGVVFPRNGEDVYENPFYLETIRGIGIICNQRNYMMNIITGGDDRELRKSIRNTKADGYIFLYADANDQMIQYMQEQKLLFVLIGKATSNVNETICVDTDNVQAGYDATKHLISNGHQRIGYIGTDDRHLFSLDRKMGYQRALHDHNLNIPQEDIMNLRTHSTHNHRRLIQRLKADDHPSAYVVCDDIYALILKNLIIEAGCKIPEDISIVSFNNSIFSRITTPPLTSFDINARQLGIEAANQLIKHIENQNLYATRIIVPYYLMHRASVKNMNQKEEKKNMER